MPSSPLNPDSGSSTDATPGQAAAVANSRADLAARLNIDPSVIHRGQRRSGGLARRLPGHSDPRRHVHDGDHAGLSRDLGGQWQSSMNITRMPAATWHVWQLPRREVNYATSRFDLRSARFDPRSSRRNTKDRNRVSPNPDGIEAGL